MSSKSEHAVELSASYAHRTGGDVHVILQVAEDVTADPAPALQLRTGRRVVRTESSVSSVPGGTRIDARVPSAELRPGVWRLALVDSSDEVTALEARLLNSRKQPIALLPGPLPRTELPAPRPTPAPVGGREKAYRAAAQVANRGLSLLPPAQADRYRAVLRRAGQRVR